MIGQAPAAKVMGTGADAGLNSLRRPDPVDEIADLCVHAHEVAVAWRHAMEQHHQPVALAHQRDPVQQPLGAGRAATSSPSRLESVGPAFAAAFRATTGVAIALFTLFVLIP